MVQQSTGLNSGYDIGMIVTVWGDVLDGTLWALHQTARDKEMLAEQQNGARARIDLRHTHVLTQAIPQSIRRYMALHVYRAQTLLTRYLYAR